MPKPQQKPQEDEGTTKRIYSILAEYAEQLRNSPDLNNKPAPRRRSNPPANPNHNSKRKKSCSNGGKKVSSMMELSPGGSVMDDHRESEDSSCGVGMSVLQDDSPSQGGGLSMDDAVSTEGSMDIPSVRGSVHHSADSNDCMDRPESSQSMCSQPASTSTSSNATHRQLIIADANSNTGKWIPSTITVFFRI